MRIETDVKLDFKDVLIRPKRSTLTPATLSTSTAPSVSSIRLRMERLPAHRRQHGCHRHDGDGPGARPARRADGAAQALSRGRARRFFASGRRPRLLPARHHRGRPREARRRRKRAMLFCLDVANGYAEKFLEVVKRVRDENPESVIMAGNVVTGDMTEALILAGADIVKIGIGPARCARRAGSPASAIRSFPRSSNAPTPRMDLRAVCADGGYTVPGDVAKAYGAGDFVMLADARRPRRMRGRDPLRGSAAASESSLSAWASTACRRRRR